MTDADADNRPRYSTRRMRDEITKARQRGLEEAAEIVDRWSNRQELLLRCGEMTVQELRTAVAVAKGIATMIRQRGESE